jgi:hypothetical protein
MDDPTNKSPRRRRRRGRPLKLNDERIREMIYRVVRIGGSLADAAMKARVCRNTIRNEALRDVEFRLSLLEVESEGKLMLMGTICKAAQRGDWRAAAWMLKKKFYRDFPGHPPDRASPQKIALLAQKVFDGVLDVVPERLHHLVEQRFDEVIEEFEENPT